MSMYSIFMKQANILIVEDDRVSGQYLKELLETGGYPTPEIVDTGEAAIARCRMHEPDLVLMDIMLKGSLSGLETAARIRATLSRPCKIIFLTAYADDEMIEYAQRTQAVAYLLKPYREKEILATVGLALAANEPADIAAKKKRITLRHGFTFDMQRKQLHKDGEPVVLSSQHADLLALLVANLNVPLSTERISRHLWGEAKNTSSLRAVIRRLRLIVGEGIVVNARGSGYMAVS